MKRGLKRSRSASLGHVSEASALVSPDEEGIETRGWRRSYVRPPRSSALVSPDEEGIETVDRADGENSPAGCSALVSPDEEGIETTGVNPLLFTFPSQRTGEPR